MDSGAGTRHVLGMSRITAPNGPPAAGSRHDATIALPDGRRLGYACYGDADGPPVVYLHGYPSSRLEPGLMPPLRGVRLIAPDRPGYGLSDARPGRTLLDWPADVAALLDALGLDRVALVGMSGGGPYAAACAYAIPDRLTATALVCPLGPPGLGWEAGSPAGLLLNLGRRPRALRMTAHMARRLVNGRDPVALARLLRRGLGLPYATPDLMQNQFGSRLVAGWREALRTGVDGPLDDACIYAAPWGFAAAGIGGRVSIWHGLADRTVPPAAGRWYAAQIPGAKARFLPGEGHFSLVFNHHRAILDDVLGR